MSERLKFLPFMEILPKETQKKNIIKHNNSTTIILKSLEGEEKQKHLEQQRKRSITQFQNPKKLAIARRTAFLYPHIFSKEEVALSRAANKF